jgi:hypothetical protein
VRKLAASVLATLESPASGSSAASSGSVASTPAPRRELRGVQLSMDGLLGVKAEEDRYIAALLTVDGITSVTIDRVRDATQMQTEMQVQMQMEGSGRPGRRRSDAGIVSSPSPFF